MTEPIAWQHSLLSDPLITVRGRGRRNRRELTLPQVFSQLADDNSVADFPKVAPHQQHPFHAFLVQLAAIALHRAGERGLEHTPERWREMLLALTDGDEGAYALVVDDLSRPGLLQPPVPEGELTKWKEVRAADALDILITAKSHDVKAARVRDADPETWFLALLSLQTMQGYSGSRSYGVARMNTGDGSRPEVGFTPSLLPGPRFLRDLEILLDTRSQVVRDFGYVDRNGAALLWLEPWDGETSQSLADCDPFFIEICRRVRLVQDAVRIACRYISTKCARVAAKERKGVLGDPWIPVDAAGEKALTVPSSGFTYERTQELLCGERYQKATAQRVRKDDPAELFFLARVLVRGKGKTKGFHQRVLSLPAAIRKLLSQPKQTNRLGKVSATWVELAAVMRKSVLKPALCALFQGAPDKLNFKDKRPDADLDRFEAAVDQRFFSSLFAALEQAGDNFDPLEDPHAAWGQELMTVGRETLENAIGRAPIPDARRYRAIAAAEGMFYRAAKKHGFPLTRQRTTPANATTHLQEHAQ